MKVNGLICLYIRYTDRTAYMLLLEASEGILIQTDTSSFYSIAQSLQTLSACKILFLFVVDAALVVLETLWL